MLALLLARAGSGLRLFLPELRGGLGHRLDRGFRIGGRLPADTIEELEALGGEIQPFLVAGGIAVIAESPAGHQLGGFGIIDLFPDDFFHG